MERNRLKPCRVNVSSETGRLRAVLLHRPGVEIERMTPLNAAHALYSDILNKPIVDEEYAAFSGVLEKWTQVYYVEDILCQLLDQPEVRRHLVEESCDMDNCDDGLAAQHYLTLGKTAAQCVGCGHCDARCPFHVKQSARMSEIKAYFGK